MELERFKEALRDALREEAEKIAARDDDKSRADVIALLEGAKCQLAERDETGHAPDPEKCGLPHAVKHKYFRRGWEIATRIG